SIAICRPERRSRERPGADPRRIRGRDGRGGRARPLDRARPPRDPEPRRRREVERARPGGRAPPRALRRRRRPRLHRHAQARRDRAAPHRAARRRAHARFGRSDDPAARLSSAFAWLAEWGVSFASLTGGVLTLFVFRRGLPNVAWIVGYLLLLWLVFAVLVELRQPLAESGRRSGRLVVTAADYTIQTLFHGLLLFVLPAYWASTTLTSRNVVFLGVLVMLTLLATFDPWYRAIVHPRPWLGYVFFVVSVFAALNVALPLIGLPPYGALVASAFAASLALTPVVRRVSGRSWRAALRVTVALGVVAATLAALGRAWIPPAPLFIARAAIVWDVPNLDAIEALASPVSAAEVRERGLVAYTAIYAPAGLRQ